MSRTPLKNIEVKIKKGETTITLKGVRGSSAN
jgi:hypothetical protein